MQLLFTRTIALSVLITCAYNVNAQERPGENMVDKIIAKIGDEYILHSDIENQKL